MKEITASVIIVAWNSGRYLPRCLDSLTRQTFRDYEVVLVDNGSTDGSISNLEQDWSSLSLRVERLSDNLGFATANNIGARLARGQWLALLNADAFPEPDWLECLLDAAKISPNASFASRQFQANAPGFLDGEGDAYHISGLVWRRNFGLPIQEKNEIEEVFSPCAAAALYPRQAFLDVDGFDEDYFSYQEDVDLGFRLRLRGLRCFYVPQAVVHHVGSASSGRQSEFAIYHGRRNLIWTYVKNMPTIMFWLFLPLHFCANVLTLLTFLLTGHGKTILRSQFDALREIGSVLRKRKDIQQSRQVSEAALYRHMEWGLLAPFRVLIQHRRFRNSWE